MKKLVVFVLVLGTLIQSSFVFAIEPVAEDMIDISVPSAVLIEKTSGEVIYEKDAHTKRAPASVTKIMTLLLTMEEISADRLHYDDMVCCSSRAASMGGSQIWLEEGERLSVDDMLKAVSVVSANDCAVALAEHIAGSEESFVARMNERAAELGMVDTHFVDCTGLTDDDEHYTTAYDIALMSRELISHEDIKKYSTIWMDSLRNGESELTNTNKLVRFYDGATGLKTGFTSKAMYCLSATAQRDGVEYIATVMHGETSTDRFESAKALLDYAFANYTVCPLRSPDAIPPLKVELGCADCVQPEYMGIESKLMEKNKLADVKYEVSLPDSIPAPVSKGQQLGRVTVTSNGDTIATVPLVSADEVKKLNVFGMYINLLEMVLSVS